MNSLNLENLPKSILERIISNLNSYQILQVQLVNTRFREICKPLIFSLIDITSWKGSLVEDTFNDFELVNIIKRYGKFCSKFNCHYFDQLLPFLEYLPNLTSIHIKHGLELDDFKKLSSYNYLNTLGCLKFRSLESIGEFTKFDYLTRLQLDIDLDLMCEFVYSASVNSFRIEHLVLELPQLYIPLVNLITLKFKNLAKLVICSTNQFASIKKENRLKLPKSNTDLLKLNECSIRVFYDFTAESNEWITKECLFIDFWLSYFKASPLLKLNLKTPPIPEEFQIEERRNIEFNSDLVQLSSYKLFDNLKLLKLTNLSLQSFSINFSNLSNLCELPNLRRLTINLIKFESTIPHLPFTLDGCLKLNRLEFPYGHFELHQLYKLMNWFPNTKEFGCFTISSAENEDSNNQGKKASDLPFEHINIVAQTQSKTKPTLKLIESCKSLISIKLPKYMLTYLNYNREGNLIRGDIKLGDPFGIWYTEKYNDFNLII